MRVFALVVVHNPEMPTSGNLKSGHSFFLAFCRKFYDVNAGFTG